MWKWIFYPFWRFDIAERKIAQMEEQGYRLDKYRCLYLFRFQKAKPRKVRYVFTYTFLRDWGMTECEYALKAECKANPIPKDIWFCNKIFRITDLSGDVSEIIEYRQLYLKRVAFIKLLLALFFAVPHGLILTAEKSYGNPVFAGLCFFACVLVAVYYLLGLVFLFNGAGDTAPFLTE